MAKKVLSEAQLRRFATLANLPVINEMTSMYEDEEEVGDMPPMGDESAEAPMDDMAAEEPDEEMDALGGAEELELTDDEAMAIIELGKKLEAAMPAGGEMEEPMEEPAMDAEEPAMDAEQPMEEPEDELMESLKGINYIPGKKEIVEEVARRVAKRLLKAKRAESALKEALGKKKAPTKTNRSRRQSKK